MVYGYVTSDGFLSVRRIKGTLTRAKYESLLKNDVLVNLKSWYGSNILHQYNNTRPHICKQVVSLLKKEKIDVLKWPPYSPDINIIENVWKLLKDKVFDGTDLMSKDALWIKIEKAILELNRDGTSTIKRMFQNYNLRLLDVIKKHGGIL